MVSLLFLARFLDALAASVQGALLAPGLSSQFLSCLLLCNNSMSVGVAGTLGRLRRGMRCTGALLLGESDIFVVHFLDLLFRGLQRLGLATWNVPMSAESRPSCNGVC